MDDTNCVSRRWEDMNVDIMVKIFQRLNVLEMTSGVGHVCRNWRMAACDPLLWKRLDLSFLKSNFINIPLKPDVYVDEQSDKACMRVLKITLSLSKGNISTLIFNDNMHMSEDQWVYTSIRCPRLNRLVMPNLNRIKRHSISQAIQSWPELVSLTMPNIINPLYLIEEISKNCKKFSELKIMGPCDTLFASTLAYRLPNLKVFSFRCTLLFRDALILILDRMRGLEVLNISHCIFSEVYHMNPDSRRALPELDQEILEKGRRLKTFLTCMSSSCVVCQRMRADDGLSWCFTHEEDHCRVDEVSSLAC